MMISTRGRYALRVMIDLAENQRDGYIPMKDVAQRQDISLKYLEKILRILFRYTERNYNPANYSYSIAKCKKI